MNLPTLWAIPLVKSQHNDIEIFYMLRGLHKHHPEAEPLIIGHKPYWYKGRHIPHQDVIGCKENKIRLKLNEAALLEPSFVLANDDHFLLAPFDGRNYADRTLRDMDSYLFGGPYKNTIANTAALIGWDAPYFDVHTPMIIDSQRFLELSRYDWSHRNTMCLKSLYANGIEPVQFKDKKIDAAFDISELKELNKGRWIFSTSDNLYAPMSRYLQLLYPERSPWE